MNKKTLIFFVILIIIFFFLYKFTITKQNSQKQVNSNEIMYSGNITENVSGNDTGNTSDNVTDNISDNATDNVSDNITDNISDNGTDNISDNVTDNISDNGTDNTSYDISDNTSDNLTRKKIKRGSFFTKFSNLKIVSIIQKLKKVSKDRLLVINTFLENLAENIQKNNIEIKHGSFIIKISNGKYIFLKTNQAMKNITKDELLKIILNLSAAENKIATFFNFPFDSWNKIMDEQKNRLDDINNILKNINKDIILVIGHTDNTGTEQYNMSLSLKRAEFISNQLNNNENIIYVGCGEYLPVADNNNELGRAENRRVEIIIHTSDK